MLDVYLILSTVIAGQGPKMTFTKQPSMEVCWVAAKSWLEANKSKAGIAEPQVGAGCGVAYVAGRGE